eukprot:1578018-Rhodomonas_salina.2
MRILVFAFVCVGGVLWTFARRYCVLCKMTGDRPVQGRLLYVEKACWVHANCICCAETLKPNRVLKSEPARRKSTGRKLGS